ncbi:FecCD family ABC transporter permease [Ilumatobacter sp.]|uniref:FecCD family ABC transporter permease n=1 Tax=Ilumatobacter sp. TaxID=1967498 RepID=UPI003B5199F0
MTSGDGAWRWYAAAVALVVIATTASISLGAAGPPWWRVPLALVDHLPLVSVDSGVSEVEWNIVWRIRAPRVVLGLLVGGMLSIGGASYQGVFRNPLVDPYLLGAAAGAGLGAIVVLTVARGATSAWSVDPVPVVAFVGATATVAVTYVVGSARRDAARTGTTLVLAGVAVTAFVTAVQTYILQRNAEVVREVFAWILGRLSSATWDDVRLCLPYIAVSVAVLVAMRRHLDLLRVGDDEARALGMSVARTRLIVVAAATLGTAAAVGVSGLIGFVGLVIPHVVRLAAGASYRHLVPLSFLVGAAFLVLADIPGRTLQGGAETPIGVVTAFLGAPFFVYLLRRHRFST